MPFVPTVLARTICDRPVSKNRCHRGGVPWGEQGTLLLASLREVCIALEKMLPHL